MADPNLASWARHDLIWIRSSAWANILATRAEIAKHPAAIEWTDRGRPVIVRRAAPGDPAGCIPFGLPLPPAQGKYRLCGAVPAPCIVARSSLPRLADALASVPALWHITVDRLLDLSPDVQMYGSLAWEHLTSLPYLSATSDLDLLWHHEDAAATETRLAAIAIIDRDAPMRIDGEIVNTAGIGVQWRELASRASTVVAKRINGATLMSRAAFLGSEKPC